MTSLRANIVRANRGERLGCYIFSSCPPPPPGGQVRTAPAVPPPATGAGVSSASCAGGVGSAARETAPAENPKPPARAGAVNLSCGDVSRPQATASGSRVPEAVILSEVSAFVLSLVAAHEGRRPEDIVALLIVGAAEAIGIHSLIMRDAHEVDLADVPDFALRAANRFRGGGP